MKAIAQQTGVLFRFTACVTETLNWYQTHMYKWWVAAAWFRKSVISCLRFTDEKLDHWPK